MTNRVSAVETNLLRHFLTIFSDTVDMSQQQIPATKPKQIRFRHQIMALMLSIILIMTASVILVAVPASLYSEQIVTFDRLKSANRLKEFWVTRELSEIGSSVEVLSDNDNLVDEVRFLVKLIPLQAPQETLDELAEQDNGQWRFGDIGSLYWQSYRRLHAYFRFTDSTYPNSDVLLVRPDDGLIIYRFDREQGLFNAVTNQATALSQCVNKATNTPNQLIFQDLKELPDGTVKGCAAKAIVSDGEVVAVLVLRYSPDLINFIMTKRPGLGETGETYIIGRDRLMRTDSRYYQDSTIMVEKVDTEAVDRAYIEGAGQGVIRNYQNTDVFSVWTPIQVGDLDWVMVAEISREEAYSTIRASSVQLMLFTGAAFVVLVVLVYGFARRTEQPLLVLLEGAKKFALGNYDEKLSTNVTSKEISDLIDTFNDMSSQIQDRTEALEDARKAAEFASQEADKANHAKSEFLSRMSHELRTPLNGVLGYAQILRNDSKIDASQRETIVSIEGCGQHLLELINDVLDIAKIESGELQIDLQSCRLVEIVDSVVNVVKPKALQKGLEFRVELGDIPEYIVTDSMKLRQILINLMGNATKFTHSGFVTLQVSPLDQSQELSFQVIDSGIGIPKEKLREIFNPFKQTIEGRKEGGTGLGLAICQQLCIALGGTFEVNSELGQGSSFSFTLPLNYQQTGLQNQMLPMSTMVVDDVPLILVVEDEELPAETMQALLLSHRYQCIGVDNLAAAKDVLASNCVNLLVLDVGCDIEADQLLMVAGHCDSAPFVLAGVNSQAELPEWIGVDQFFVKSLEGEKLLPLIETYLPNAHLPAEAAEDVPEDLVDTATVADAPLTSNIDNTEVVRLILIKLEQAANIGDLAAVFEQSALLSAQLGEQHPLYQSFKDYGDALELPEIAQLSQLILLKLAV
ncbi:Sensor histidine kinase RcsC [Sinobacterium norvegicum]|uniref:histidine kinase n=1 Tax=Sinobacterium norvegicum TaxID=1641715 RepID=A0ABM9AJK3_9GAMM|nr:ATP-binding protein [Sinobacterium norvegicum]CAH0993419.1 Sensor histidine kinase RcsC [Sinobacterium norvegicum]